jgi:hypothetical protein
MAEPRKEPQPEHPEVPRRREEPEVFPVKSPDITPHPGIEIAPAPPGQPEITPIPSPDATPPEPTPPQIPPVH